MGKKWIVLALAAGLFPGALTAQQESLDWGNAQWIKLKGDPRPESPLSERTFTRRNHPVAQVKTFPAPLMRHEFTVPNAVKSATAHVCGLGYFELYLNGSKEERYPPNSFSHPMHSGFAVMFHESIGGIRPDPEHPGFERIILKPCFLPRLEWAKAEHRSPQGLISSHWKRKGTSVIWQVSIPTDSSAMIELSQFDKQQILLNGKAVEHKIVDLKPGQWTLEIK